MAFVIECAVVARTKVRLIAGNLMIVGDRFGAELHPAIHKSLRAYELPFHGKVEVPELLLRPEELVLRLISLQRCPPNDSLLDPPGVFRITLPAIERAVEE